MKILLVQPPHYYQSKSRKPSFFPLGLGYIAQALLRAGHEVQVGDIWAYQWANEEVEHQIGSLDYDVAGISALSTQYGYVKSLTAQLKKCHSSPIAIGGALATLSPEIVLKNTSADFCILGEGEITFKEAIENIKHLEGVKGICFKQNGEIIKNPPREYIEDLDTVGFPAWELFPMDIYLENCTVWGQPYIKALNVIAGRGCPYSCRFCSKTFKGVRFRSPDSIVAEIEELKKRYDIGGIFFNDELLVIDKKRLYELCDKIEPLGIKWNCQGRVNLVDLDLLKRMKKAGCVAVGYGIESGSQSILDNMNKKTTIEQAERALRDTVAAGMQPIVQMMYGYPGETRETLQETVDFFKKAPFLGADGIATAASLSITTPLPGTELYDYALKEGKIRDEENYLTSLSAGYMHDGTGVLTNFTSFGGKEFYQLRRQAENKILWSHIKRYPLQLLGDYLRKNGAKRTLRKIWELLFKQGKEPSKP